MTIGFSTTSTSSGVSVTASTVCSSTGSGSGSTTSSFTIISAVSMVLSYTGFTFTLISSNSSSFLVDFFCFFALNIRLVSTLGFFSYFSVSSSIGCSGTMTSGKLDIYTKMYILIQNILFFL